MVRFVPSVLNAEICAKLAADIAARAPASEFYKQFNFFPPAASRLAWRAELAIDRIAPTLYVRAICGYFITRDDSRFEWHTDAQYDGDIPGITIWIPLQDCGVDRPSLETEGGRHICRAGDALIFSSFARHRTFVPEGAKYRERIAAVFRYRPFLQSKRQDIAAALRRGASRLVNRRTLR